MKDKTKIGLAVLKTALVLGVLGDILLRETPWGVNVLFFNAAFAAAMIMLVRQATPSYLNRQTLSLFGAWIFFASMFAWRDSVELHVADTFAIIAILGVLFVPRMEILPRVAGVFHYVVGFVWSALNAAFAPVFLLMADIKWNSVERTGWSKHIYSVVRGIAIAVPLLLIFGGLFVAADAAYQGMLQRVFDIRPEIVITHFLLTGVFAWLSAGYLRGMMFTGGDYQTKPDEMDIERSRSETAQNANTESSARLPNDFSILEHINISEEPAAPDEKAADQSAAGETWSWAKIENAAVPQVFTLGTVEIGVVLGLVNLLFLSFVVMQVPYLFGGMELVQNSDYKLSEYARRGFGELVVVAGLVLPMLLAGHWLVRRADRFAAKLFRVLACVQIALLFVIMASAVQRLVLLTGNLGYGLTTIRLYPLIFMSWLAIVFVWLAATVLFGNRKYFAWGALWSAFLILGATHWLNPDELIVKTNLALMQQGREFDARYNSQLSDDALPVLFRSIPELDPDDQQVVFKEVALRNCLKQQEGDLRSWNYSRMQASDALASSSDSLKQVVDTCGVD